MTNSFHQGSLTAACSHTVRENRPLGGEMLKNQETELVS
jgi:hypothetical protein